MKTFYGLLIFLLFTFEKIENAEISTGVNFDQGEWVGSVECQFHNQDDCELSIHVNGRRIDIDTANDNEQVFESCYSSDTAIALAISNLTYDDVQEYICLQDTTLEYQTKWMVAYPDMIVSSGTEEVGATASLTCNSFVGAPLYWVLPNNQEDNRDVNFISSFNDVNTTATIVFQLQPNDNFAEYKCCLQVKDNQRTDIPCASHTFRFDNVEIISYTEDYFTKSISMECDFGGNPPPDSSLIQWRNCSDDMEGNSEACFNKTATNVFDGYIVKSTLSDVISENEKVYQCSYDGDASHVFEVTLGTSPPSVTSINQQIFNSGNDMAVQLTCNIVSNLPITVTWKISNDLESNSGYQTISSSGSYNIDTNLVDGDNWESVLFIYPYDANIHNVNYTCVASNQLGSDYNTTDTIYGPSDLSMQLSMLNSTNTSSLMLVECTYTSFPNPNNHQITVVSSSDVEIANTRVDYDQQSFLVRAYVEMFVSPDYQLTLKCLAFDGFHPSTATAFTMSISY